MTEPRPRALCGICSKPATMGAWGHVLCGNCFAGWHAESPRLSAIAGMVPPEDIEMRKEGISGPLVLLKEGVVERVSSEWTAGWVTERRRELAREAARQKRALEQEAADAS